MKISTPGRICLFGEHQDYLGLPIIASAISKRISIEGSKRNDKFINIDMPDLNTSDSFEIAEQLSYKLERDYLRSSFNIMLRQGFSFSNGFDCVVHGDIPINSGTSSSSALIVSWINFLSRMSDQAIELTQEKIAELAYQSEVLEFTEPGGMMDHYSTSVGNLIWLESVPKINLKKMTSKLGAFVLGNSKEPKDTKDILARVKVGVINIVNEIAKKHPEFSLQTIQNSDLSKYQNELSSDQFSLLKGTVRNRDITYQAYKQLTQSTIDHNKIGELMNEHQAVLRDVCRISTNKIDRMIDGALNAGALGAKINGSGGGGCMFAYAPENTERVVEAVKSISGEAWIIKIDEGTKVEVF